MEDVRKKKRMRLKEVEKTGESDRKEMTERIL